MYFSTSNGKISDIVKKVESVGFECAIGPVDFIYEWDKEPTKEEILDLADKLAESLKDTGVMFNIDTQNSS